MLIIRETEYAIRATRALSNNGKLNVKQICALENIPAQFAYKILKKLAFAGILEITKGARGGYKLLRSPERIRLYDIIKAVERVEKVNKVCDCLSDEDDKMKAEFDKLNDGINSRLKNLTLDMLI